MANIVFVIQREVIDASRSVKPKVLFPIEPAWAASLLTAAGHTVVPLDLNLLPPQAAVDQALEDFISRHKPDVVVSVPQMLTFLITEQYQDTARLFATAKKIRPECPTIYCGPFATAYPEQALTVTGADYLIRGEFEQPLAELVERLLAGEPGAGVHGVCRSGEPLAPGPAGFPEPHCAAHLDFPQPPAYELFNYREYFKHPGTGNLRYPEKSRNYTHYQSSRGCTSRCCFCNVSYLRGGRKYRCRDLELVIRDIDLMVNRLGIEEIHFLDENISLNRNRLKDLCERIIAARLSFSWIAAGGLSVYTLDRPLLELMRSAGCYRLNLAFESGSQEVLDRLIHKPVKLDRDLVTARIAKDMGFEIIGYFVIGIPGETREQLEQTVALAANPVFDYVTLSIATPQAGTDLERTCRDQGLVTSGADLAGVSRRATGLIVTDQFSAHDLERIRWQEWDRINFSDPRRRKKAGEMLGITLEEIESLRRETRDNFERRWQKTT